MLVVVAVGVVVRAPLSRVPENTMKFAVGIMLTSFGVFWGAEGAGVSWPGNDAALLAVIPATALVALGYLALLRRGPGGPGHRRPGGEECRMSSWLRSFGAFWYDFVIGDDWRGASGGAGPLAATALLVHVAGVNAWWLMPVCAIAALGWSLRRATTGRS